MLKPEVELEEVEKGGTRDFDFISTLNGYPEVFSAFEGDEIALRVARKPGFVLPRGLIRALWRFTPNLRQRVLERKARRCAATAPKPVSYVKRVDVYDRVGGRLVSSHTIRERHPIFAEMPSSYRDEGAGYTCRIAIDTAGWPAGVYECVVHDDRGAASRDIYVNVKPRTLDETDLLCILPSFTWQAYNRIGGGSFYSPELGHLRTICTQRPMRHAGDNSIAPSLALLSLFRRNGVRLTCVDSWDLHRDLAPKGEIPTAAILVHDEYWSASMRAQVDRLLDCGVGLLVLSGNTCWWRVEVDGPNVSVRKEPSNRALWHLTRAPEEQTFVSSFRFAGYAIERARRKARLAGRIAHLSKADMCNAGAMTATDPDHPLFAGVALGEHRSFGRDVPVVYRELDAVPLNDDGTPSKSGYKAPELNPQILATGLALYGKKLRKVGLVAEAKVRNGFVLHMGSIGWSRGVSQKNETIERIVMNAYAHCRAMAAITGHPDQLSRN